MLGLTIIKKATLIFKTAETIPMAQKEEVVQKAVGELERAKTELRKAQQLNPNLTHLTSEDIRDVDKKQGLMATQLIKWINE
jgi:hypothetical protein